MALFLSLGIWSVWSVSNPCLHRLPSLKVVADTVRHPLLVPGCHGDLCSDCCGWSSHLYGKYVTCSIPYVRGVVSDDMFVCTEISPWTGRFYSLLDPSYAKNNIPIIASVSEHQPTTWSSFYFDLQLLVFMFPGKLLAFCMSVCSSDGCYSVVGLFFCFSKLTDQNIFIILYGVTSVYFAVSVVCLSCTNCTYIHTCRVSWCV